MKNRGASKRAVEAKKNGDCERGRERCAGKGQSEEERNSRGSLVRLCEIKTRFTGSFYCGYGVSFVSLWTCGTAPFNRFNEYIVPQWSRWEYRALPFFFSSSLLLNNYLQLPAISFFRLLFVSFLLIPLAAFAQQTKHLKQPFITRLRTSSGIAPSSLFAFIMRISEWIK